MLTKQQYDDAVQYALNALQSAGIVLTQAEKNAVEIADFGLGKVEEIGLQILTYVNTARCCAKEMVLRPFQVCPEHRHVSGVEHGVPFEGKEETFRVRRGVCYLYVEGERNCGAIALPDTKVTVFHEIVLREGEQYTMQPNTRHWFRAGEEGAIVSEFSTKSRDESDVFEDERIIRIPEETPCS